MILFEAPPPSLCFYYDVQDVHCTVYSPCTQKSRCECDHSCLLAAGDKGSLRHGGAMCDALPSSLVPEAPLSLPTRLRLPLHLAQGWPTGDGKLIGKDDILTRLHFLVFAPFHLCSPQLASSPGTRLTHRWGKNWFKKDDILTRLHFLVFTLLFTCVLLSLPLHLAQGWPTGERKKFQRRHFDSSSLIFICVLFRLPLYMVQGWPSGEGMISKDDIFTRLHSCCIMGHNTPWDHRILFICVLNFSSACLFPCYTADPQVREIDYQRRHFVSSLFHLPFLLHCLLTMDN